MPVGVNDAMTFVQEGTENEERTITNNRVKVKVKVRDNVLMSAVAGPMEEGVRYAQKFVSIITISNSDKRTIRDIWMHHPLQ